MKSLSLLALTLISLQCFAAVPIDNGTYKDRYAPYPSPYPQIIQAFDYPTIDAIETFVHELKQSGKDSLPCNAALDKVTLKAKTQVVFVGAERYTSKATFDLFSTLKRLVKDLSKTNKCSAARFAQWGSRSYQLISTVEFGFGPQVVEIQALSNGPTSKEKLYVLDVVGLRQAALF